MEPTTDTTTTTRHLIDAETGEDLGPATAAQIEASDREAAKNDGGIILIDEDGDPQPAGSWDAQNRPMRSVYVEGE